MQNAHGLPIEDQLYGLGGWICQGWRFGLTFHPEVNPFMSTFFLGLKHHPPFFIWMLFWNYYSSTGLFCRRSVYFNNTTSACLWTELTNLVLRMSHNRWKECNRGMQSLEVEVISSGSFLHPTFHLTLGAVKGWQTTSAFAHVATSKLWIIHHFARITCLVRYLGFISILIKNSWKITTQDNAGKK
jgi:hypothetical protein